MFPVVHGRGLKIAGQLSNGALKPHTNTAGSARLYLGQLPAYVSERTTWDINKWERLGFLSPTLIHFCGYGCVFLVAHGHREGHLQNVNIQVCELV